MKLSTLVIGSSLGIALLTPFAPHSSAQVPTVEVNAKKLDRITIADDATNGVDKVVPLGNTASYFVTDIVVGATQGTAVVTITTSGPQQTVVRKAVVSGGNTLVIPLHTAVEVKKNGSITVSSTGADVSFTISGYTQ